MINFKDRKSQYPNRRLLEVKGITKGSNGEIEKLVVDIIRDNPEWAVEESGTALNATTLNEMFKAVNKAIEFLFKQYFSAEDLTASWVQTPGVLASKTFRINLVERFYGKVICPSPFLTGSVQNTSNYIDITIGETQALNNTTGTSTKIYDFHIELYTDAACTKYVTKLEGTVNYTNTSTAPLD